MTTTGRPAVVGRPPFLAPDVTSAPSISCQSIRNGLALQRATIASSQAAPKGRKNGALSLHDLDGEPGQLVGSDVLGRSGGLAGDQLEVVPGRDVDYGAADALHAGVALVALLRRTEEQAAVLVRLDVAIA